MSAHKGCVPWNNGTSKGWVDARGYRVIRRTINGRRVQVREHRAIMEEHLGRVLEPWELVHHKDGNLLNNAIENLEPMTFGQHTIEHHQGSRRKYDTRRSMEAFANMREELKRVRSVNAELLQALRGFANIGEYREIREAMALCLQPHERDGFIAGFEAARAAIEKAEGKS